jgi:hypothetical protein
VSDAPKPGVVITPPHLIADSIKSSVEKVFAGVEPGHGTAMVEVELETGVNLVIGHRFDGEKFDLDVATWIGKSWAAGGNVGAAVRASW